MITSLCFSITLLKWITMAFSSFFARKLWSSSLILSLLNILYKLLTHPNPNHHVSTPLKHHIQTYLSTLGLILKYKKYNYHELRRVLERILRPFPRSIHQLLGVPRLPYHQRGSHVSWGHRVGQAIEGRGTMHLMLRDITRRLKSSPGNSSSPRKEPSKKPS